MAYCIEKTTCQSWKFELTDGSCFLTSWSAVLWSASWDITKEAFPMSPFWRSRSYLTVKTESFWWVLSHLWVPLSVPPSGFSPGTTAAEMFTFSSLYYDFFHEERLMEKEGNVRACMQVSLIMLKEGTVRAFSGLWKCDEWGFMKETIASVLSVNCVTGSSVSAVWFFFSDSATFIMTFL